MVGGFSWSGVSGNTEVAISAVDANAAFRETRASQPS